MARPPLTDGDGDPGCAPDLTVSDQYCGIVDAATGAVCTKHPHGDDRKHQGFQAVHGGGRDRRVVTWSGGNERAMVVEQGYAWTQVPGTDVEVRVLGNRPVRFATGAGPIELPRQLLPTYTTHFAARSRSLDAGIRTDPEPPTIPEEAALDVVR